VSHGQKIRQFRETLGLTQMEVCERTGVSRSYLSQIETGVRPGSLKVVSTLAEILNVPVGEIFDFGEIGAEEATLLEAFGELSSEDRKAVLRHATALNKETEMRRLLK
jgi:transcriptional regulator with XRE-family HTH domain